MAKDYSIECAPPYDDTSDHSKTAEALKELLKKTREDGKDTSLVLLVDDTTHPNKSVDFESYGDWLRSEGFDPNLVARESQIVQACSELLEEIDYEKVNPSLGAELKSGEPPSQLFIAAWCLMRLGYIDNDILDPELQAERIVNILPESFRHGEEESLEIIRSTRFAEAADRIGYLYINEES